MEQQRFVATLDALEPIRNFVKNTAQSAGLDRKAVYKLCLAVDEIATNIVVHGYEEAGLEGDLKIGASVNDDNLVIELEDQGKPYDPKAHAVPDPGDLDEPLESRKIGGLGIFLTLDAVDEIQYNTTDEANIHRFIVRLPPGRDPQK